MRGQHDWAEVFARRAVELQEAATSARGPNVIGAHLALGLAFYWQDHYEAALQQYEHERAWIASSQHAQRDRIQAELEQKFSAVLWRMGRREESDRHFREALEALQGWGQGRVLDPLVAYGMAALLTVRGEEQRGIEYLDEARRSLPAFVQRLLSADPDFQSVRLRVATESAPNLIDDMEASARLAAAETVPDIVPASSANRASGANSSQVGRSRK